MTATDDLARALRGEEPRPKYQRSMLLRQRHGGPTALGAWLMVAAAVAVVLVLVQCGAIGR